VIHSFFTEAISSLLVSGRESGKKIVQRVYGNKTFCRLEPGKVNSKSTPCLVIFDNLSFRRDGSALEPRLPVGARFYGTII